MPPISRSQQTKAAIRVRRSIARPWTAAQCQGSTIVPTPSDQPARAWLLRCQPLRVASYLDPFLG
jgi:hypothetical protein